ncbi:MAG: response regulator [Chloroflexi bacterium]|nr:response regulator [Chloroflexota bacterium]
MAFKILIIDDHPETRSIIGHVLKQQGYVVITAENGRQEVEAAERELPHIIFCDYMMPIMDGVGVVRTLRAKPAYDKTPIIMFTAVDDPHQKLTAFDAGADDYLNKPTEPSELIDRVKVLLESSYGATLEPLISGATILHPLWSLPQKLENRRPPQTARRKNYQLTAVTGVRGGVGTTTMAINLAACLAQSGDRTALVDFDLAHGHIGLYLNQKTAGGVNNLASMTDAEAAGEVAHQLVPYTPNLNLLLAHLNVDGRYPLISGAQAATVLTTLSQSMQATVVDLGAAMNEVSRSTLEIADHVIICLRPERIALIAARQLLATLKKYYSRKQRYILFSWISAAAAYNFPKRPLKAF